MSNGNGTTQANGNGRARWAGVSLTAGLAVGALIVQWGVVTTKLDQVEKRLDEFIAEASELRSEYREMERRVAFLEGRLSGQAPKKSGP